MSGIVVNNNIVSFGTNVMGFDLFNNVFGIYSVRKVLENYTGYCMRVRRSSDNTELDIGFIGSDLDTASILSFVGGGQGHLSIWYDQSGKNHNVTQVINSAQPLIVFKGTLQMKNGKPAVWSINSTNSLDLDSTYNLGKQYSLLGVLYWNNSNTEWLGGGSNMYGIYQDGNTYYNGLNGTYFRGDNLIAPGFQYVVEIHRTDLNALLYVNNTRSSQTVFGTENLDFLINNLNGESSAYNLSGYIQETIIFRTNKITNRDEIYNNMNNYFGVI